MPDSKNWLDASISSRLTSSSWENHTSHHTKDKPSSTIRDTRPPPTSTEGITLGLTTKFFPHTRTALADEASDLIRNLVCDAHFVESFDRSCSQLGNSAAHKRFGKARVPRQFLEILWPDFVR